MTIPDSGAIYNEWAMVTWRAARALADHLLSDYFPDGAPAKIRNEFASAIYEHAENWLTDFDYVTGLPERASDTGSKPS